MGCKRIRSPALASAAPLLAARHHSPSFIFISRLHHSLRGRHQRALALAFFSFSPKPKSLCEKNIFKQFAECLTLRSFQQPIEAMRSALFPCGGCHWKMCARFLPNHPNHQSLLGAWLSALLRLFCVLLRSFYSFIYIFALPLIHSACIHSHLHVLHCR